jgi:hypothetical protein
MLRSTFAPAIAAVLLCVAASSASAQVIYEPVQYQYGDAMKYYYGGNDPAMHAYADRVLCRNGFPSSMYNNYTSLHNTIGQIGEKKIVMTDCLPLRNAAVFGFDANDARNEAYANVPRYYRKGDLLNAAVPAGDGTLTVSAQAQPRAMGMARDMRSATSVEPKPRAILILPKKGLKKDADTKAVILQASAR